MDAGLIQGHIRLTTKCTDKTSQKLPRLLHSTNVKTTEVYYHIIYNDFNIMQEHYEEINLQSNYCIFSWVVPFIELE